MIRLQQVTRTYHSGKKTIQALNKVTLSFPQHGLVAVLGPSGCGKTTLLNILGGLDRPDEGVMSVHGVNTADFKEHDWDSYRNHEVGFIFQNYYLIPHLNVRENVALTLQLGSSKKNIAREVDEALTQVGLLEMADRRPNELSGGQMQRVAIARALVSKPSVLLADEPTGALDSKTAEQIMALLQEIAQDRLVVLVTHNRDLADRYANEIVELKDGEVVSSTLVKVKKQKESLDLHKVRIPLSTSFKISLRNLWKKKLRSGLTIVAGSIGIIGVGLILSMTSGISDYIVETQRSSLGRYPVSVSSYLTTSSEAHEDDLVEYPDYDYLLIEKADIQLQTTVNRMDDRFLDYMDEMDESYYTVSDSNSSTSFTLLTAKSDNYVRVQSSYFTQMVQNRDFLSQQYDCLQGRIPEGENELAIVIDEYNRVSASLLDALGFDISGDRISFDTLCNEKEYRVVDNNDYYVKSDGYNYYRVYGSGMYETLYQNATRSLKIVGILRENRNIKTPLYSTGMLYTAELGEALRQDAFASTVVQEQIANGLDLDVFTGEPFQEVTSGSYAYSPEYQYQQRLYTLGTEERITRLYYYTDDFESRLAIADYVQQYPTSEDDTIIVRSYDYLELVTTEFSSMVAMLSNILLVFACISILVSAILIAILTYISVMERHREIGLLRSIGARRQDVASIFLVETSVVGFLSGILGIIGAALLVSPLSGVVRNMVAQYGSSLIVPGDIALDHFQWWCAPILLVLSLIVSLLAGTIPSLVAAHKKPADSLKDNPS